MKYEYNGILVESDTPLDSAVFRPVENELPTTRETETDRNLQERRRRKGHQQVGGSNHDDDIRDRSGD